MTIDHLASNARTWQPTSPIEVAAWWREIAASEPDPVKADDYRLLADSLDRFLKLKGSKP